MIDRDHPAVEAVASSYARTSPARTDALEDMSAARREQFLRRAHQALTAALPHLTADDLRDTPAGRDLIREGIAAARNLEWMQPVMTPGGHIYNPAIPGDQLRAAREDALAREAMQNMRESEQGRALMAEAWEAFRRSIQHDPDALDVLPNPYRGGDT